MLNDRHGPNSFLWRHAGLLNWISLAIGFCLALLAGRIALSDRTSFIFLAWNLALALAPLLFSVVALGLNRAGWKYLALFALVPWLLFLPNAPYILTDLLHLKLRPPVPLWYDLVMLLAFALTGLLFGYLSMICAERVLLGVMKRPWVMFAHGVVLFLCGFGIYLGRFLRWNSWELATRPSSLLKAIADRILDPSEHPTTWMTTFLVGSLLIICFALTRGVGMGSARRG
ncbi:MAG: DUF1361 domain-containing protein [Flavobacteriales bacterium]